MGWGGKRANSGGKRPGAGRKPKVKALPTALEKRTIKNKKDKSEIVKTQCDKLTELNLDKYYQEIYDWVKCHNGLGLGLEDSMMLYAMNKARWVQAQNLISISGLTIETSSGSKKTPYAEIAEKCEQSMINIRKDIDYKLNQVCVEGQNTSDGLDDLLS